jgi:hypothetical protein
MNILERTSKIIFLKIGVSMETTDFICTALESLQRSLDSVLEGLTRAEITWQPAEHCNSIGLILFHTTRSEDFFVQELMRNQPQVWEKDQWYVRFNIEEKERGRHYGLEQVKAFIVPEFSDLRDYNVAVRRATLYYLKDLKPEDFIRGITTPRGQSTVAGFFSNILIHAAQHLGEMSYLRGIQRGLNK